VMTGLVLDRWGNPEEDAGEEARTGG